MGQAVVWYTGQFYALFFLTGILKVDGYTANLLVAWSLLLGTIFFVVFGALSDRIGRKPIILGGCLLAALTFFPIFQRIAATRKSVPSHAIENVTVSVSAVFRNAAIRLIPWDKGLYGTLRRCSKDTKQPLRQILRRRPPRPAQPDDDQDQ